MNQNEWQVLNFEKKVSLKNPILIVGLPGIGNVGKIVVDFLIDELKAKKLHEFRSFHFPNTVFVTEDNLVSLPTIELFYKKVGKYDLLLMSGDVQPTSQESCYEFCTLVLDMFSELKGKQVITLGGIGLQEVPDTPKVFCTGTTKKEVDAFVKGTQLNPHIYGVVGAFVGVAGVLVGLAGQRNIPAVSMLAETFAHPYYIGIKGSKEILTILRRKLGLTLDVNKLDKEIKEFEKELMQTAEQIDESQKMGPGNHQSYIG
ncbi:MAG: PAC2 family protein [Candidatus Woesearchaeota archaeon]|jgi:hypothetical protein